MPIFLIFSILFGLSIGSFLNVVILRMPLGQSIIYPRSYCPKCKNKLSSRDLIPVLSWLIALGKCRYCKNSVSYRYPLIELLTALFFVFCLYSNPSDLANNNQLLIVIYGWILVSINIPLAIIDIDEFWLPSKITNSGIIIGIIIYILQFIQYKNQEYLMVLINHSLATLVIFISLRTFSYITKRLFRKEILGVGDANLMAMAAAWLGSAGLEIVIILSILSAGFYSTICIIGKLLKKGSYIPLGAFIAPSILFVWILGNEFWIIKLGNLLWWRYI